MTKNVLTAQIFPIYINQNLEARSGMGIEKNPQNIRFHGDQCVAMATKKRSLSAFE